MCDEGIGLAFFMSFVLGFLLAIPIVLSWETGTEAEREKAIKAGVGHWVIDAKTRESNFVYGVFPLPPERSEPCD